MDVDIPIIVYDVTTAVASPRLIVTCRTPDCAQDIAGRLNAMRGDGTLDDDPFTVTPRQATTRMTVVPGSAIEVQGFAVDVEALAVLVDAGQKAKDPVKDPGDPIDPVGVAIP